MKYRSEIDGLRALAVVPVILFHAGFTLLSGGYVGVDVFFVISGYLITTILMSELDDGKFSIVRFYERRARRLMPALFLVMACCLPFAWLWMMPEDLQDFSESLMAVTAFVSNILFWQEESSYFNTSAELKPLLHTWSLAVEEQFYLLFPPLLLLAYRVKKNGILILIALISAISLSVAEWGAHNKPVAAWFLLPTRAWELGIGAMVAMYFRSERPLYGKVVTESLGILGLCMIVYAIVFFDDNTVFPGLYGLIPVLGTALVIMFAMPATVVGRILGSKVPVAIGLISYSAYLWHQPLLAFAKHRSIVEPGPAILASMVGATFVLAWLSWRYVETPFRNPAIFSRKRIFTYSAIGMTVFFAVGLVGMLEKGFDSRIKSPEVRRLIAESKQPIGDQKCWDRYMKNPSLINPCIIGDSGRNPSFAIVGDSHASMFVSEFTKYAKKNRIQGLDITLYSCPLFLASERIDAENGNECSSLGRSFRNAAGTNALPKTLILSARWTLWLEQRGVDNHEGAKEPIRHIRLTSRNTEKMGHVAALSEDYKESINRLLRSGHKVILIYPVPEMGWSVPKYLAKKSYIYGRIAAGDASISHSVFKERNARTYAVLDGIGNHPNLIRIYPEKILCDTYLPDRCVAQISGNPVYSDDDHLSSLGVRLVLNEIEKHL